MFTKKVKQIEFDSVIAEIKDTQKQIDHKFQSLLDHVTKNTMDSECINSKINNSIHNACKVMNDKIDLLALTEKTVQRLVDQRMNDRHFSQHYNKVIKICEDNEHMANSIVELRTKIYNQEQQIKNLANAKTFTNIVTTTVNKNNDVVTLEELSTGKPNTLTYMTDKINKWYDALPNKERLINVPDYFRLVLNQDTKCRIIPDSTLRTLMRRFKYQEVRDGGKVLYKLSDLIKIHNDYLQHKLTYGG